MDLSRTIALDLCDPDRRSAVEHAWPTATIETDPGWSPSVPFFACNSSTSTPTPSPPPKPPTAPNRRQPHYSTPWTITPSP